MFERYTERARRVLFFARYEASQLGSMSIETEHLLLGLIREGNGLPGRIFARAHVSLEDIRKEIEGRTVFREKVSTSVEMPLSQEIKRMLNAAAEESDRLGHNCIGAEHILLGILREERSVAASVLMEKGMRVDTVREDVGRLVREEPGEAREAADTPGPETIAHPFDEIRRKLHDEILGGLDGLRGTPTHVVLVTVTIRQEMHEEFERALLHNARESVRVDRGCLRFDVSQDKENPARWVLHEVYDSPEAHAAHRLSPHFLAYDDVAARAVVDKTVLKCAPRHVT